MYTLSHMQRHGEGVLAHRTRGPVQDGRDVPDGTSIKFTEQLEKDLAAVQGCDARIASGGGRMHVTMDRYEVTRKL